MTARTKSALQSEANTNLADNSTRQISASDVRTLIVDMLDSLVFQTDTDSSNDAANLTLDNFAAANVITAAEGIPSNNNDTTFPTSAAVYSYVTAGNENAHPHISAANSSTYSGNTVIQNVTLDPSGHITSYSSTTFPQDLDSLTDVDLTSEADGHLLIWNNSSSKFVNAALTAGSGITLTAGAGTLEVKIDPDATAHGVGGGGAGDIEGVTAGNGLSGGGTTGTVSLAVDLNELTEAAVADGDYIAFIDTNDSSGSRKEAVHDLATLFAGDGLTATNSVIAVDTVTVAKGGTGATSLTDGGILLGNGTGAVTAMSVLGDGVIVVGDNSTDPTTITAFTASDGVLKHEVGGLELDISAIAIGDVIAGTGTGSVGIVTSTGHSDGDVLTIQADGTVDWETPSSGGASDINGLSDCLVENNSIFLGNDPSSTTSSALYNIALGTTALEDITTGDGNVAIGYNAAKDLTTGTYTVAIGYEANVGATTYQSKMVVIGYQAGESSSSFTNRSSSIIIGAAAGKLSHVQDSVIIGQSAGQYIGDASNTEVNIIAIGSSALSGNSSDVADSYGSIGIGYRAGRDKGRGTAAHYCIYLGFEAGYADADHASNMLYIANDEPSTTGAGGTIIKADMEEKHLAIGQADLLTNSAGDGTLQIYPYEAADEAIFVKMPTSHSGNLIQIQNSSGSDLFVVDSNGAVEISPYGTSAGNTGEIRLLELAANGTNYVGFKAPDAIGASDSQIYVLPAADGSNGQQLTTDGNGNLSWAASGSGGGTTYTAGDGLDLGSDEFSVDLKANGGLVIESTELAVDLAASSITGTLAVGDGGTGLTSIATLLNSNVTPTSLGLVIGTNVQAYDAQLATLAGLTADQVAGLEDLAALEAPASDGQFIVATGAGAFAYESGATVRTSLGLGSIATLSSIDISANTNLAGGTGITLTGDTLSTTDSEIVHDNLSGFVANEHIDHSSVSVSAGTGLTGGGTIASTRTLSVDINGTADLASPAVADELLISDADDGNTVKKADLASIVNLADHDALTNFVANEHIDWTASSAGTIHSSNYTDTNTMGSGFTVSATTDTTATTITEGEDLFFAAGAGITCETTADGTVTIACNLEGTELASTGETGTSKFLRVDGDGTCSWQVPPDTDTTYTKASFDIDHLFTLVGASADTDEHLGTFTGSTIADNQTIKAAIQAVETAVETKGTGTVDGSGAAGYVAIWSDADTLTYDNNQLYWDSSNNELGIGTATPASTLHVAGTVSLQPYTISSSSGEGDTDWDTIGANTKEIGAIAATTYLIETGSTDRTIELPDPASTLVGRTYTIKKTDSGTGKVVIQPYSSGSAPAGGYIDGDNQTTGKGGDTLYCQYDVITATCAEGTTSDQYEWHIVEEKVRAHTARVEQTSAQSINDDVVTQITFDADDFEFGADADHANDKIIIKRAGVYHITGFYSMTNVVGGGNYIKAKIGVTPSGGSVTYHAESSSRTMDPITSFRYKPATVTSVTLELDVDDEITLYGLHTDGGHENTRSATDNEGRCFLEVKEIR